MCSFLKYLGLFCWPILSVILGIVCGSIFGMLITMIVFLITLVRTPMHICKMLYVAATTDKCFSGYLGLLMRISVFVLVPLPHLFFLLGITIFSGTIGLLYYIGKTTQIFYNHEYKKTLKTAESNAKLEPKSYLGKYIKKCQEFMADDTQSYPTIYFLKGCSAAVPGVILGVFPFIPFTLAVLGITIIRLPINMYKTIKIALLTVMLKWDLRLMSLITLPIIHILVFPLVVFITALVGSFFYFTFQTSRSIYHGKSPFQKWDKINEGINKYYKAHQEFVSETCGVYDHPSGIPNGWRGDSYGLPVQKILKWQWDFLMCCFFVIIGVPTCLVGSSLLAVIKLLPSYCYLCFEFSKEYFDNTCITIMGTWPFYLLGMVFLPLGVVLLYILVIPITTLFTLEIPMLYLDKGYLAALYQPLHILRKADDVTSEWFCGEKVHLFSCLPEESPFDQPTEPRHQMATTIDASKRAENYWDKFMNQCIKMTSALTEKEWISLDDVRCMDPSVIESIPGVAVLTILVDSVGDSGLKSDELKWTIDGTVCKNEDRPTEDGIIRCLWPMVFELKKLLLKNQKKLLNEVNIDVIKAMICENTDDATDELKTFLKENLDNNDYAENNMIRTKINNLVLGILRVKPYQDRMNKIYSFDYTGSIESGRRNNEVCLKIGESESQTGMESGDDSNESSTADQMNVIGRGEAGAADESLTSPTLTVVDDIECAEEQSNKIPAEVDEISV